MRKTLKIKCIITGKENLFSGDYLSKKVEEYGDEESLKTKYICKEVKSLLVKGYKVTDIRNVLDVSKDVKIPDQGIIDEIENKYKKVGLKMPTSSDHLTGFTYNKSDSDVEFFIKEYIIKHDHNSKN